MHVFRFITVIGLSFVIMAGCGGENGNRTERVATEIDI
jgi:hypothetical protein